MRVKSIRRVNLDTAVPVYDLSVPDLENFKLEKGPYVHNSKDCSDAMAGVAYGLTMRKEIWIEHDIPLSEIPASVTGAKAGKNSINSHEAKEMLEDEYE